MSRMTTGYGALFQEGPGGRIIEMEHKNQVDSMRRKIKLGVNPNDPDRRKVIWIEIPKDQESNYLNPGGFAIQGANSIYTETKGPDKIPDPGQDVGAWAENLASRIDQTEGVQKTPISTVIPTPTTTPSMASTQGSLVETVARSAAPTSTIVPSAATTSASADTLIPSLKGAPDTSFQFNPQRTLLDASMIAGEQKRIFKLHFIYPKQALDEVAGKIYENRPAGTGTGNYAWTGNWELSTKEMELLEERIRRSLGESGVTIAPGIDIQHSEKDINDVRVNWDGLVRELGIGNMEYDDETVPVYLIRGLGAYAGGSPGENWSGSFLTMGDSVIESLAGFKGKTAYELIQNFENPTGNQDDHKFYSSWQAQMGTVLHEGFHAVAALPHRTDAENPEGLLEKGMLLDYAENYAGAHGEEFAKLIDDAMRGKQGTDKFAALNIIMNEPWNYGWGEEGQDPSSEILTETQPISTTIPTSTQGPLVETVGREKASSREGPLTIQRTEMPSGTIGEGTGLIETMSRSTSSSTIETPNEDIIKDMYEATRRGGTFRTGRTSRTGIQTSRTGMQSGRLDIRPYELRPDEIQDDLSIMPKSTKDPLIQTIPRLRGQ